MKSEVYEIAKELKIVTSIQDALRLMDYGVMGEMMKSIRCDI